MEVATSFLLFLVGTTTALSQVQVQDVVSASVLERLTKVESVLQNLQEENKKLQTENLELRKRLDIVEKRCKARDVQLLFVKKRLKQAEKEIALMKISDTTVKKQEEDNTRKIVPHFLHQKANQIGLPTSHLHGIKHSGEVKEKLMDKESGTYGKAKHVTRPKRLLQPVTPEPPAKNDTHRIAFSAHTSGHLANLGAKQNLKLDVVNINEGGSYDKRTGAFTCPVAGTYHFEATIMSLPSQGVSVDLVVNGAIKARLLAQGFSGHYGQSSNSLIVHLNQGDDVWVQSTHVAANVHGDHYSHFAGFILWAD